MCPGHVYCPTSDQGLSRTSVDKKYALRHELLERNPQLKKHWWTRALVGPILMGAAMNPADWRRIRPSYYFSPILILVFAVNFYLGSDLSTIKRLANLILLILFCAALPLVHAVAYGFKNREKIDITESVKPDFRFISRHRIWWVMVAVGVSTGTGIFGWMHGWGE